MEPDLAAIGPKATAEGGVADRGTLRKLLWVRRLLPKHVMESARKLSARQSPPRRKHFE
jgi:hypothetical protein